LKKKLRILYISQYFPPEIGATQTRAFEMASNLVRRGHHVTVLTEFPNHPRGIISPEYRRKLVVHEKYRGIHVHRTWVLARPDKTFATRMGFYLSFMVAAGLLGIFIPGYFDIVYATSPPFFVGLTGWWLSRIKQSRFVFEVRDLWPQSAVELGELGNPLFIRWAEKMERFYYRKAKQIVTVTKGIQNTLVARGYPKDKIQLITNGTNITLFINRGKQLKKTLGFADKFVVLYAGIFGIAQGMEQLCDVVEQLKKNHSVHFLFIGEGPVKDQVIQLQKRKKLDNLTVLNEIPREDIPDYISAVDCSLVPLKKSPTFLGALPSKMFDCMACERPVVLSVDGEARRVLEKSGGGIFVEPGNTDQMVKAILRLKNDPVLRRKMGLAGRRFVEKNYSRKQKAIELEELLLKIVTKE
jgi:glycosyltransferase involved in cell wall biosynthesis